MNQSLFSIHKYKRYYQKIEPAFKDQKTHAYIMVILSLFTISFFGFFAIRPTLKTITTLQRQIEDRSKLNDELEAKINNLILAQDEYQRIEQHLPLVYTMLPEKADFPLLLRMLENLALQNSATIAAMQFDPILLYGGISGSDETDIGEVDQLAMADISASIEEVSIFFTLSYQSTYENLVALLDQLTKINRVATIQSVELTGGSVTIAQTPVLNLVISTQAYYYPSSL